jgi:hypothetical protein
MSRRVNTHGKLRSLAEDDEKHALIFREKMSTTTRGL